MGPSRSQSLGDGECGPRPAVEVAEVNWWGGRAGCGPPGSRLGFGLLPFFLLLGRLKPWPRPLTPDPPLLPRRTVTADPYLSIPSCGLSTPAGIGFGPAPAHRMGSGAPEASLEGPSDPFPTPGSRLGPQSPPPRAPWGLILAQASVHSVSPGLPLAAIGGGYGGPES